MARLASLGSITQTAREKTRSSGDIADSCLGFEIFRNFAEADSRRTDANENENHLLPILYVFDGLIRHHGAIAH